ncbi:MAG TPA: hypothetical protein VFT72_01270 [Opitutaceae bacterium]|nr:hypothetical protein [Opitutaceae bacterium]
MNPEPTDPSHGHVNTPSQMVTPIQPITDDLPKVKPARTTERLGGLTQEEAGQVTETAKINEVPPAEAMEPHLYRDDEE